MLDLFTIFSKSGIVLWYFQGTSNLFTSTINELIKSVILEGRAVNSAWNYNSLSLEYKLDNEFELVFVVAYQNILKLTYIDKLLTEIQLRFRDKYKQAIQSCQFGNNFDDFKLDFDEILECCEKEAEKLAQMQRRPRKYEESEKSTRTVASMIETKTTFIGNLIQSSTGSDQNAKKTQEVETLSAADFTENFQAKNLNSPGPRQMRKYEPKS